MKPMTELTIRRLTATRNLCAQLPDVFTRKDYDALRDAHIKELAKEYHATHSYPRYLRSTEVMMARNESAFNLSNLIDEDFLIVVKEEPMTITKEVWDWKQRKDVMTEIAVVKKYYRLSASLEDFFCEVLGD